MVRLVILSGIHRGEEWELQRGSNLLGRAEGNDFLLEDPAVSGRHCEIVTSDFSVKVRDLGSSNGTFIDQQRILEAEIKDGQTLSLGAVAMRLVAPLAEIVIPPLPGPEVDTQPMLPDGTAACRNHPDTAATHQCVQCQRLFCEPCVRRLKLVGGKTRLFCPACSGHCPPLDLLGAAGRRNLAQKMLDALRTALGRKPRP